MRFVDAPVMTASEPVIAAPAAPPAAAPPSPGAIDDTPAPPAPPAGAYVVSFEGKNHNITGVTTVGELRDEAAKACGLATCRLVYKGDLTRDPSLLLKETKLRPGAKCLVMRARR